MNWRCVISRYIRLKDAGNLKIRGFEHDRLSKALNTKTDYLNFNLKFDRKSLINIPSRQSWYTRTVDSTDSINIYIVTVKKGT